MREPIRCPCDGGQEKCIRCSGSGYFIPPSVNSGWFGRTQWKPIKAQPKKVWSKTFAEAAAEAAAAREMNENAKRLREERRHFADQLVKCPFCGRTGHRWEIRVHAEKKHKNQVFRNCDCVLVGREPKTPVETIDVTDTFFEHQSDPHKLAMKEVASFDDMDATRNIGYFAWEGNRFGSHPIHDGFDDESNS